MLNLSDNARERIVTVGSAGGRKFTGQHGDGVLTATGYVDVPSWTGTSSGDAAGAGTRGDSFYNVSTYTGPVANREEAYRNRPDRDVWNGGRGCRTAP